MSPHRTEGFRCCLLKLFAEQLRSKPWDDLAPSVGASGETGSAVDLSGGVLGSIQINYFLPDKMKPGTKTKLLSLTSIFPTTVSTKTSWICSFLTIKARSCFNLCLWSHAHLQPCCARGSCRSDPPAAWRRSPEPETRRCRRGAARGCARVSQWPRGRSLLSPWSRTPLHPRPGRGCDAHLQPHGGGGGGDRKRKIHCLITENINRWSFSPRLC